MNSSGTLLAMVGEQKVVISVLPPPGFMDNEEDSVSTRCFEIGALYSNLSVLKVLWNELGKQDASLVVLTSDTIIRSYDLTISFEQPELEYNLSNPSPKGNGTGGRKLGLSKTNVEDPVSMCFGSSTEIHGKLTLYIYSKDGDVFALYPFSPRHISVTDLEINQLFDEAALLLNSQSQEDSLSPHKKSRYVSQLSWVSDIWKQRLNAQKEYRADQYGHSSGELFLINTSNYTQPSIQGPFSLIPFPDALYEGEGCDIISVDTENFGTLVTSNSVGRITIMLQDIPLVMKWENEFNKYYDENEDEYDSDTDKYEDAESTSFEESTVDPLKPSLSVVESKQISRNNNSSFTLYKFKSLSYNFFAFNDKEVIKFDISEWVNKFNNEIINDDNDDIQIDIAFNKIDSKINLSSNNRSNNILGLCLIDNLAENRSYITIIEPGKKIITEIESESQTKSQSQLQSQISSINNFNNNNSSNFKQYVTLLDTPSIEIKDILKSIKVDFNLNPNLLSKDLISKNKDTTLAEDENMATLKALENISELVMFEVAKIQRAGLSLQQRITIQQSELFRQLTKINDFKNRLKKIDDDLKDTNEFDKINERNLKFSERLSNLSDRLAKKENLPISNAEREWFKELRRIRNSIEDPNKGLKKRVSNINEQLTYLKSTTHSLAGNKSSPSKNISIGEEGEIATLKRMLYEESKIVKHAQRSLENTLAAFEKTSLN